MTPQLAGLAVLAGVLSIASPCVLPLLPAYVSVISTTAPGTAGPRAPVRAALLFVCGFTVVFVAFGAVASAVGQAVRGRLDLLAQVAGVFLIVVGVRIAAGARARLPLGHRIAPGTLSAGPLSASRPVALGAAVAVGWTPCIGPILASVLALSASTSTVYEGAALLMLYSAGLGVPFVAVAVGLDRSRRLVRVLRLGGRAVERGGGVLLIAIGVGYVTGWWSTLFRGVQGWVARTGWPPL